LKVRFERRSGLVVVWAHITGNGTVWRVAAALDTASTQTLLSSAVVARLSVAAEPGEVRIRGISGEATGRELRLPRLEALGRRFDSIRVLAGEIPSDIRVGALLGLDVLGTGRFTLDFDTQVVETDES
jgi:hypothetical protein